MTTTAAAAPRTIVAPEQQPWLREIAEHRDLFLFFIWRDVKIRYKQTFLGALWAIIQPLTTALILTAFVSRMTTVSNIGGPYAVFAYSALAPWTFFSTTVSAAAVSMTSNANLLTKIYFPRIAIPATPVLAGLVDFAVASSLLLVIVPFYGLRITPRILLWPLLAVPLCVLCLGLGILFACWTARYRDMKYALPFAIQLLLFATPIIYPVSIIPRRYQWLAALNPLTGLVQAFRFCVLPATGLDAGLLIAAVVESVVIFVIALIYLRRTERVVADYV
jgi:lipopolysaccharide transport system permease protein